MCLRHSNGDQLGDDSSTDYRPASSGVAQAPLKAWPAHRLGSSGSGKIVAMTRSTPTVHLLAGLNGAGKTTHARRLERDCPAVRFTLDEWMLRLYQLRYDDPRHPELAERCKDLIWATAQQVPAAGTDVVLDSNQWSRTHRATWRDKAMAAGYHPVLHYLAGARRDRHRSGRTPCSRRGQRRSPPRWPSRTASRPPLRSPNPRQGLEVRIGKQ
jgi:hypothetical protein